MWQAGRAPFSVHGPSRVPLAWTVKEGSSIICKSRSDWLWSLHFSHCSDAWVCHWAHWLTVAGIHFVSPWCDPSRLTGHKHQVSIYLTTLSGLLETPCSLLSLKRDSGVNWVQAGAEHGLDVAADDDLSTRHLVNSLIWNQMLACVSCLWLRRCLTTNIQLTRYSLLSDVGWATGGLWLWHCILQFRALSWLVLSLASGWQNGKDV